MNNKIIYFRADGGPVIGLGHIVRCNALAQILNGQFRIKFVCKEIPGDSKVALTARGFELIDISNEDEFFTVLSRDEIVVLDHYGLDSNYQKIIKDRGAKLVCIDDLHDRHFYADWIINISPNVKPTDYIAEKYTKYAIGTGYVLLRPTFLNNSGNKKKSPSKNELLLCLGGSDYFNKTLEILSVLKDDFAGNINIVVGASYLYIEHLTSYINEHNLKNVFVYCDIDEYEMVELMQKCGIAICSPSSISFEYLSVTRGVMMLVLTAENQRQWFNYAKTNDIAVEFSKVNLDKINNLQINFELQDKLFDGCQKENLLRLFEGL